MLHQGTILGRSQLQHCCAQQHSVTRTKLQQSSLLLQQHRTRCAAAAGRAFAARAMASSSSGGGGGGDGGGGGSAAPAQQQQFAVKVCGVTCAEDAAVAVAAGASHIGLIAWPNAKRSVPTAVAAEIAAAARAGGAMPVAVFVDESPEAIKAYCEAAGIDHAQLHGDVARASLSGLGPGLKAVYVLHADAAGAIQTAPPPSPPVGGGAGGDGQRGADWVLVDGLKGGSGEAFDWTALQRPEGWSANGWLLAGGLHPDNVAEAVSLLRPGGVDVSSGVCGPDGLKKDPERVRAFVANARQAAAAAAAAAAEAAAA